MSSSAFTAIYLRKSRDKAELADPDLLHKHRRELLRLAGQRVASDLIFEEQGSGDTLRQRPVCRRLLEAIERLPRGAGGQLWTTEVSRLTRGDLSDRARVHAALSRAGVHHCTRGGRYDLNNTDDLMQWEILTSIARHELGTYRDRVAAARLDMALEARLPTGKPPFGWLWDRGARNPDGSRGAVITDPARFPIVCALAEEALYVSIYQLQQKYGIHAGRIHALLRNPFIAGYPVRRHFVDPDRCRRDNGEPWQLPSAQAETDRWIWPEKPGAYEAACTLEHWRALQEALDHRRSRRDKTHAGEGWCKGVVRFVGYEGPARLSSFGCRGKYRYLLYEWSEPGVKGRSSIYIRRDQVHAAVEDRLRALFADTDAFRRSLEWYDEQQEHAPAPLDTANLQQQIERLERLYDAATDSELRASLDGDHREMASARRQKVAYRAELETLEKQAKALAIHAAADPHLEGIREHLQQFDFDADWPIQTETERQAFVVAFVEEVRCRVERVGPRRWCREVEAVRLKPIWHAPCNPR